jgi:Cu-processing system permease protein
MRKIVKYVLLDLVRNRVIIVYTILLAILAFSMLGLDNNASKGILSLLNLTLLFVPIISILFATIYFFNSIEFIELLLAQPIKRKRMLLAEYYGVAFSLCIAYFLGIGVPLMLQSAGTAGLTLIVSGILLTLIFTSFALLIFVLFKDKTKGIGAAIIASLFFTLLFDGLLVGFIYSFSDYPIEKPVLALISLNPVDLARILVLLKLDVAVLMGYSGALFKKFLGSATGTIYTVFWMLFWVIIPLLLSTRIFKHKDL